MTIELNIDAERPLFERAMLADGKSVARSLPEYGGLYRFVEERWQGWLAGRAQPPAAAKCAMAAFLEKLDSPDPAVRAQAEAHAERVADELSAARPHAPEEPVAAPVLVPGGQFEQVGTVQHERVNDEYNAALDEERVVDGEKLYRFVPAVGAPSTAPAWAAWIGVARLPHKIQMVVATDFDNYALAYQRYDMGETIWLDAQVDTERDVPLDFTPTHWLELPSKEQLLGAGWADVLEGSLDADDIAKLRDALVWMGESTPESLEECAIYRVRMLRRLIAANLAARDYALAEGSAPEASGPVRDHEIRELVNQLRDVAVKFHHTGQLRSRIQSLVLPMFERRDK